MTLTVTVNQYGQLS